MSSEKPLFDRLDCAMRGNYPTWSTRGDAMWQVISRTPHQSERVQLVSRLLTTFHTGFEFSGNTNNAPGNGVDDAQYDYIARQHAPALYQLVDQLLAENRTITTVARRILQFLQKLNHDNERAVVIAILLRSRLVPYAQLPNDIFQGAPGDYSLYTTRARVAESIALVVRVLHRPQLTVAMLSTALQKILNRHSDPHEINTLLCEIIKGMMAILGHNQNLLTSLPAIIIGPGSSAEDRTARALVAHLLEHLPDDLRVQISATHHCSDPSCELGGKQAAAADKSN